VFNNLGQLLISLEDPNGLTFIDVEQLREGMYLIKLKDFEQNSTVTKFIKKI